MSTQAQFKAGRVRRLVSGLLILGALGGSAGSASATDSIFDFFQQLGGGGGQQQALPQPDYGEQIAPPLTVRRHERRRPVARVRTVPRMTVAELKDVTIYTDRTLAPGDAVMTKAGMRVFNGSASWPYKDGDFVALASTSRLSPTLRKELKAIDLASRADLRNQ